VADPSICVYCVWTFLLRYKLPERLSGALTNGGVLRIILTHSRLVTVEIYKDL
jgi:hypothetical protein